jgi:hypothetical protein
MRNKEVKFYIGSTQSEGSSSQSSMETLTDDIEEQSQLIRRTRHAPITDSTNSISTNKGSIPRDNIDSYRLIVPTNNDLVSASPQNFGDGGASSLATNSPDSEPQSFLSPLNLKPTIYDNNTRKVTPPTFKIREAMTLADNINTAPNPTPEVNPLENPENARRDVSSKSNSWTEHPVIKPINDLIIQPINNNIVKPSSVAFSGEALREKKIKDAEIAITYTNSLSDHNADIDEAYLRRIYEEKLDFDKKATDCATGVVLYKFLKRYCSTSITGFIEQTRNPNTNSTKTYESVEAMIADPDPPKSIRNELVDFIRSEEFSNKVKAEEHSIKADYTSYMHHRIEITKNRAAARNQAISDVIKRLSNEITHHNGICAFLNRLAPVGKELYPIKQLTLS